MFGRVEKVKKRRRRGKGMWGERAEVGPTRPGPNPAKGGGPCEANARCQILYDKPCDDEIPPLSLPVKYTFDS